MSDTVRTLAVNARWEALRLRRSTRLWLLLIPPVAAPVGSAIADVYLRIPSQGTALVLGVLITGGLAGLVLLDLVALSVGEDLTLRSHLTFFTLPQRAAPMLGGRLLVAFGGPLVAFGLGAGAVWVLGGALVTPQPGALPIFDPVHLAVSTVGFLVFLGGVTSAAAVFSRSSSQGVVAGVLAGVVVAGLTGYLLVAGHLSALFPIGLAVVGFAAVGWTLYQYGRLES
ncbi:MAG TPA: hypothetical protein VIZ68_04270 [Thermoplasmata archaeon]